MIAAGLSTGLGVSIMTFGLPVVFMMWVWRLMARFERFLASRLLGVDLPSPYRPAEGGWFARLLSRVGDPATWKDLAYLIVHLPLGIVDFTAVAILLGLPVSLLLAPLLYLTGAKGVDVGLVAVDSPPVAVAAFVSGLLLLPICVRVTSAFATLHATFARMMLTASTDPEVATLRSSQARIIAAADAERRRLERDLHDGAQQRLVAVALQLRMARDRLARGEDALELVSVAVRRDGDALCVEVTDDGRGGADPSSGSGLRGLADRVAALNGTLTVISPVGEGTVIRAHLPAEIVDDEQPASERGIVYDERAAAIMRLRRRRGLLTHAAIFGVVQLALIVIWAWTGLGYFWPGWTVFGWGLILALHASLAILRQPITELDVTREQSGSLPEAQVEVEIQASRGEDGARARAPAAERDQAQ